MTSDEFLILLKDTFMSLLELSRTKGVEYAGTDNAFKNFEGIAADIQLPREKILWVYFTKHLYSIRNYINGGTSSEPIAGRIDDAILYLVLLKAMLTEGSIQERTGVSGSSGASVDEDGVPVDANRGQEQHRDIGPDGERTRNYCVDRSQIFQPRPFPKSSSGGGFSEFSSD